MSWLLAGKACGQTGERISGGRREPRLGKEDRGLPDRVRIQQLVQKDSTEILQDGAFNCRPESPSIWMRTLYSVNYDIGV